MPPAREVIAVPRGYATCHIVPTTYRHGVWTNEHKVCQYPRGVWAAGHWQCVNLKHHKNICMQWSWIPSRWEGSRVAVYNVPRNNPQPIVYAPPVMAQPAPVPARIPQPVIVSYNN